MFHTQVRDVMTERVFALRDNHTLCQAYDLMEDHQIHHVPVVTENFELVGILSLSDVLQVLLQAGAGADGNIRELLETRTVSSAMTPEPETISPEDDICEAGRILIENRLGSLPVVESKELLGILTRSDFVRFVIQTAESAPAIAKRA